MPQSLPGQQYVSGNAPTGPAGTGTSGETLTTNTPDPFRELLLNLISSQATSTSGQVPASTLASIEALTKNPAIAAEFFPQLAKPLLASLAPTEGREVTQLNDLFRKAGGTGAGALQSGAYAQAGRQLIGDQAGRRQELLAKNYIPLTSQLSENTIAAQKAGLQVPEANAATYRNLVPLVTGLQPLSTRTQQTGVNQTISAPGGALTPEQQAQMIASQVAQYSNLGLGGSYSSRPG